MILPPVVVLTTIANEYIVGFYHGEHVENEINLTLIELPHYIQFNNEQQDNYSLIPYETDLQKYYNVKSADISFILIASSKISSNYKNFLKISFPDLLDEVINEQYDLNIVSNNSNRVILNGNETKH
jgi:hypothetical protein